MKIFRRAEDLNPIVAGLPHAVIVFTNGVFDILHPGHVELLEFSRAQGDRLIVGVNDDDSVRRLKGDKRPIFPLEERMELLSAMEAVDWIVPFSQDTPLELIRSLLRIDVLVKGGDYRPEDVVGRREVEAQGGKLIIYPLRSGYSTSAIIEKILRG